MVVIACRCLIQAGVTPSHMFSVLLTATFWL